MLSRRPRTAGLIAVAATTTLIAVPASAGAATTGATTIDLKGASASALSAQKVGLSAQKPAKATAKRITLPVASGTVATGATLKHRGSVTFRARVGGRTRSAKLTALETKVGTTRSTVTAKLGAKRLTLFTIAAPKRAVKLDRAAGTASLRGGTVRLTPAAAKALRGKLALRRLPAGQLGAAKVTASVGVARTPATRRTDPTPGTPTPGTPTPTPTDPTAPRSPPIENEPPVLARPATAIPVTGARLTWWVRDSFIAYIAGGSTPPATGTAASNGATAQAPILSPAHLCKNDPKNVPALPYAFDFGFKDGWYDEASGVAGVYFGGTVSFVYRSHGIDLSASDPEIEVNGAASRSIFRFDGGANTRLGNKRGPLTNLDFARAQRTVDPVARTVTYGPVLGTLAEGSANSFAGFYFPGDGYGCVQLSFSY